MNTYWIECKGMIWTGLDKAEWEQLWGQLSEGTKIGEVTWDDHLDSLAGHVDEMIAAEIKRTTP